MRSDSVKLWLTGDRIENAVASQWQAMTLICGMQLSGMSAAWKFRGSTFASYEEDVLPPQLPPGEIVIENDMPAPRERCGGGPHSRGDTAAADESGHAPDRGDVLAGQIGIVLGRSEDNLG